MEQETEIDVMIADASHEKYAEPVSQSVRMNM